MAGRDGRTRGIPKSDEVADTESENADGSEEYLTCDEDDQEHVPTPERTVEEIGGTLMQNLGLLGLGQLNRPNFIRRLRTSLKSAALQTGHPKANLLKAQLHATIALQLAQDSNMMFSAREMDQAKAASSHCHLALIGVWEFAEHFRQWISDADNVKGNSQELYVYLHERLPIADGLFCKYQLGGAIVEYGLCLIIAVNLRRNIGTGKVDNHLLTQLYMKRAQAAFLKANQMASPEHAHFQEEREIWMQILPDMEMQDVEQALDYSGYDDAEVLFLAANIYKAHGKLDKALKYAKAAAKLDPQNERIQGCLASLNAKAEAAPQSTRPSPPRPTNGIQQDFLQGTNVSTVQRQREQRERFLQQRKPRQNNRAKMKQVPRRGQSMDRVVRSSSEHSTRSQRPEYNIPHQQQNQQQQPRERAPRFSGHAPGPRAWPAERTPNRREAKPPKRREAKPSSVKSLDTIQQGFENILVCQLCCIEDSSFQEPVEVWGHHPSEHTCRENILLVRPWKDRKNRWYKVRQRPRNANVDYGLCEQKMSGDICKENPCPYPHNDGELYVWSKGISVQSLITDLTTSNLRLKSVLQPLIKRNFGTFDFFCKTCSNSKQEHKKERHKPLCSQGHSMKSPNDKVMYFVPKAGGAIPIQDDRFTSGEGLPSQVNAAVKDLTKRLFTNEEIVEESKKCAQSVNEQQAKHKSTNSDRERTSSASNHNKFNCDEEVPVLEYADIIKGYMAEIDRLMEDALNTAEDEDDDDREVQYRYGKDTYYNISDEDDLRHKLESEPEVYKHCRIHINGAQEGQCRSLDGREVIQIRGRMNCGPSFEGDEVLVEVMETEELDKKTTVRRGKVVGILKRNVTRTAHVFVCTVDQFYSNLMIPVCGTCPKIHVVDSHIRQYYREKKNNYVDVYDFTTELELKKVVKIDPAKKEQLLFVVKYLKWHPSQMYPLGYVCSVMPAGQDMKTGQRLLNLIHQVPVLHTAEVRSHVELQEREYESLTEDAQERVDLTHEVVFSVDPEGCMDVDDALSVSKNADNTYSVGVHIADVSSFVTEGGIVDEDARKRATSFYAADPSVSYPMLPTRLSHDLCSLLPDKKRCALSVLFRLSAAGKLENHPEITRTWIKSAGKLTYAVAQECISQQESQSVSREICNKIQILHALAQARRKDRIGDAKFFNGSSDMVNKKREAHEMVEELMLLTNRVVAEFLGKNFPDCLPLRKQDEPQEDALAAWKEESRFTREKSFYFKCFERFLESKQGVSQQFSTQFKTQDQTSHGTIDRAHDHIFSISPEGCLEIDSAFEIFENSSGAYSLGIHVIDLSPDAIAQNKEVDAMALETARKSMAETGHSSVPDLMPAMNQNQDARSLLPDHDRCALSLLFKLSSDGMITRAPTLKKTLIRNKQNLTYREARDYITKTEGEHVDEALGQCVRSLHRISQHLRRTRFGDARFFIQTHQVDDIHRLIGEFMLLASRAATHLDTKVPFLKQVARHVSAVLIRGMDRGEDRRDDLSHELVFSISSNPDVKSADCVSVCEKNDGTCQVGVHIADGSSPSLVRHPAFPAGQNRGKNNSLSAVFLLSKDGELTRQEPIIKRTYVGDSFPLTYEDVQQCILKKRPIHVNRAVYQKIAVLQEITQSLRRTRLGETESDRQGTDHSDEDAVRLVGELMLLCSETLVDFSNKVTRLPLLRNLVEELNKALQDQEVGRTFNIYGAETFHPLQAIALSAWYKVQNQACFVACGKGKESRHFSLQMSQYTQFTSPIRRYMDIVVHRMVHAALDNQENPYTMHQLEKLCEYVNVVYGRAKKHGKANNQLQETCKLMEKPVFLPGIIREVTYRGIQLLFPHLPHQKGRESELCYSHLDVAAKPDVTDDTVILTWQKRIYDARGFHPHAKTKATMHDSVKLDPNAQICNIPIETWENIQEAIIANDEEQLRQLTEEVVQHRQRQERVQELTSEMKDIAIVKHHVSFSRELRRGSVVLVQMVAECKKGLIKPSIRLLNFTDEYNMCVRHTTDPVSCFADIATKRLKASYPDIDSYQRTLMPILQMEAACNSVADSDPIVISNAQISLDLINGKYYGRLELPQAYCKPRHIKLLKNSKDEESDFHDFLCLRCPFSDDSGDRQMWVGHAVQTKASTNDKDDVVVEFGIHHMNEPPPGALTNGRTSCHIELLAKTLPDRRMEDAVNDLPEASTLCKKIALGQKIPDPKEEWKKLCPRDLDITVDPKECPPLPKNNDSQTQVIRRALTQRFTLIQGPPGTGKTITGIKLAYWYSHVNAEQVRQKGGPHRQVLYCGPSNSSVDVAAKMLQQRLGSKCPKILRVYSGVLQNQVFPIPRDVTVVSKRDRNYQMLGKEGQKTVVLHYLIRQETNKYHKNILAYDKLFKKLKKRPEDVTDEQIEKYQKLVTDASMAEVKKYDIILCTCAVSASPVMVRAANVAQIIIDECGMCMEPESLVPLVAHKDAEQVVLVGDHRQLRPIVKNATAQDLGLERSLFERYGDKAIMLNEQYRMHNEICAFPSKHFYDGNLRSPLDIAWMMPEMLRSRGRIDNKPFWPNRQVPLVFCHVEGAEKTLVVSTDDGSEHSKSNDAEINHATRIYRDLVNDCYVPENNVTILTQYKAQCKEIERTLKGYGYENPLVSTVVASQGGEWEYVILSTVRSLPTYEIDKRASIGWLKKNLGFIIDHHQINVALTRAIRGLIIVGNKNLLECDSMWRELLNYYRARRCLVNAEEFLQASDRRQIRRNVQEEVEMRRLEWEAEKEQRRLEAEERWRRRKQAERERKGKEARLPQPGRQNNRSRTQAH